MATNRSGRRHAIHKGTETNENARQSSQQVQRAAMKARAITAERSTECPVCSRLCTSDFGLRSHRRVHTHTIVCWLLACFTSQQHVNVSQGRICSDNFTCCHTEIEAADPTFYLTQSQYSDTGPTSPMLTLYRQAPGRVASGVPILKSLV